jgi:UDP-glucose 4-epimerase
MSYPSPVTAYDHAKLAAEDYIRSSGAAYAILRPVPVYGPGPKGNVSLLAKPALSPWPIPWGGFRNRRRLVALENVMDAITFCIAHAVTRNETFIVADPEPISLAEVLEVTRDSAAVPNGH